LESESAKIIQSLYNKLWLTRILLKEENAIKGIIKETNSFIKKRIFEEGNT